MITSQLGKIRERKFLKICKSWLGTRFGHHMRYQNLGVDCIHYVIEVFYEAGLLPYIHLGYYSFSWWLHRAKLNIMEELKEKIPHIIVEDNFKIGDILVFFFGKANEAHIAIYIGKDQIIHSVYPNGVMISSIKDKTWKDRIFHAMRLT